MAVNRLRVMRLTAADRAEDASGELTRGSGSSFGGCLDLLGAAWQSPSQPRRRFEEDLAALSEAVRSTFESQAQTFRSEALSEPREVDPSDPVHGWKADPAGIAHRVAPARPY